VARDAPRTARHPHTRHSRSTTARRRCPLPPPSGT
jgi:hypothetical protein